MIDNIYNKLNYMEKKFVFLNIFQKNSITLLFNS